MVELSVVVPVYRNAETLAELHRRLSHVVSDLDISSELIFVEDACPDGSLSVLAALARSDPRVVVLPMARNVGQHRAVLAGLAHSRGNVAVIMDADLQDPPEAIPALLKTLAQGFGAVFAGRRGRYESPMRLLTSRLFKYLLHLCTTVPRDAGLFVVVSHEMKKRLLELSEPTPFVTGLIGFTGLPTTSIPVQRAPRLHGNSAYSGLERLRIGVRALVWAGSRRVHLFRRADRPMADA